MSVSSLREVITAGEQLQITPKSAGLFGQLHACRLQNQYGPTESHVVTVFTLSGPPAAVADASPIGRPIANADIYILDPHLQPVPIGVTGEIHIGGAVLARGYLGRADLTEERFIADPFCRASWSQVYKSGDLARYLPDGNIQYLGRNDGQVKIRGYRVELGEIEAVLSSHPVVRQAVITAVRGGDRDTRLMAYVTIADERLVDVGEMKSFLEDRLPAYMVPSHFMKLDSFPLTPKRQAGPKVVACRRA